MKAHTAPYGLTRRQLLGCTLPALAGTALFAGTSRANSPWRLAVVPQLTPIEMYRNWAPLVDYLAAGGLPCELVVHPSIATFEVEFRSARADFLYLNPYHMVLARRMHRYQAMLRASHPLEGVMVVRADSEIVRIAQLARERISFPAPNALAASLYIRAMLERDEKISYTPHFAMNHRNAVRQVLSGDSAAAGVVKATLELEPLAVQRELRVIYTTPPLAPHPVSAHPRVPLDVRSKFMQRLMALTQTGDGKALLKQVLLQDPVAADYERDYARLNRLELDQYVQQE